MSGQRIILRLAVLAALVVFARAATSDRGGVAPVGQIEPLEIQCLEQTNADGFGNENNVYSWAMQPFGAHLYVGTFNTVNGGIGLADELGVLSDPGTRDIVTEGAEIWRYDGSSWEQVVDAGFDQPGTNQGVRNLVIHDGLLYAATLNSFTGAEIWRSANGTDWEQVGDAGFGNPDNISVRGLVSWNGLLYAGTENQVSGAEVWTWDGASWTKIADAGITDPDNLVAMRFFPHAGSLFAGTYNTVDGAQVLRYDGSTWTEVVGGASATPGGWGNAGNGTVLSMSEFLGELYVGTGNFDFGFGLYRTADAGATWEQVGDFGFGDPVTRHAWRMHVHDGELYLGNYRKALDNGSRVGGSMWHTADGDEWIPDIGDDGELAGPGINNTLNYGVRTLATFQDALFIGTAQCFTCPLLNTTGTEVWRRIPECVPQPPGGGCGGG